jgi:predicted MFS family arabinose efflux permease
MIQRMRTTPSGSATDQRSNELRVVLIAGGLIVMVAMGIRQSFGLYLAPVSEGLGTGRETFSLAMAIQNIVLGLPLAGLIADRIGGRRVAAAGGLLYATGLATVSVLASRGGLIGGLGLLAGSGLSAVSYVVVLGAVGRVVSPERRSSAFGVITAAGSFGMFAMVPISQAILTAVGWETAFLVLAGIVGSTALAALRLPGGAPVHSDGAGEAEPFWEVVSSAARNRNYWLLVSGFFVCGFHVAFVATHLPAYLGDQGIGAAAVAWSLAMIGLFNIGGSWTFGRLGDRYRKRTLLSVLYGSRAVTFVLFLLLPLSPTTAVAFGAMIGFLWLGTIPLTSGAVAAIFGVRHLGTLYGVVFMSHQVGAFLGVWLGGRVFDATGDYTPVWILAAILGVFAALVHLPLDERPAVSTGR